MGYRQYRVLIELILWILIPINPNSNLSESIIVFRNLVDLGVTQDPEFGELVGTRDLEAFCCVFMVFLLS
jgi:hypothetical protein